MHVLVFPNLAAKLNLVAVSFMRVQLERIKIIHLVPLLLNVLIRIRVFGKEYFEETPLDARMEKQCATSISIDNLWPIPNFIHRHLR